MSIANGYVLVWNPNHPRANVSGMVYEHILMAEKKLGRYLTPEEVVHHINHVRNDNRPENLLVFSTKADHTAFHMGCELIYNLDGTVRAGRKKYICKSCGALIDNHAKLCAKCHRASVQKMWPTRDYLKNLIRTIPFEEIGKMFNVTGNAVRKWCKAYNLPYRVKDIKLVSDVDWAVI